MEKFTKGPWFVSDGKPHLVIKGKVCVSGEDGEPIVVADTNYYFEESRDNAALIAAAPEMYEMLKVLLPQIAGSPAALKVNRLLAKARGES